MKTHRSAQITPASPTTAAGSTKGWNRRAFVKGILAAGAAANLPLVAQANLDPTPCPPPPHGPIPDTVGDPNRRRWQAYNIRVQAALKEYQLPVPPHPNNGDETRYRRFGTYSKGMPHNDLGEVDQKAYDTFLHALASGKWKDFERIPLGCSEPNRFKFVNIQAGLAFDLEGADSHALCLPPAPPLGGPEVSGEMLELYWMALTRDVPFAEYETNPLTIAAAADLNRLGDTFKGPRDPLTGKVTPATLFRDNLPGCLLGPYVSQFRWWPVPFGSNFVSQQMRTALPGQDFVTDYAEWLRLQNSCRESFALQFDPVRRYIRNGRDSGLFVHIDTVDQAAFMAMLTLLYPPSADEERSGMGAPLNPGNPYLYSQNQVGFGTFGLPHISSLLPEAMTRALKAVRFQKWFVHRRIRPEEYGGLLHNAALNSAPYPVWNNTLIESPVWELVKEQFGSLLLPQAYPEGCPLHPSYGSGHATVVGACVTLLKAWFDENYVIPDPIQVTPDGLHHVPYTGPDRDKLTVGGELNKLASNFATSRNIAGVHYRSDAVESLKLGEAVAISILQDQRCTYNEDFDGFTFTRFDGTKITV